MSFYLTLVAIDLFFGLQALIAYLPPRESKGS